MKRPKKAATKNKSKLRMAFVECVPVTAEELHFALTAAYGAASGRTPRSSFIGNFEEAVESGEINRTKAHLVLTDAPENHAAFAIMEAFPEKSPEGERKRRSLLWRAMFAVHDISKDARFSAYTKIENGQSLISAALMEAIAKTPMTMGADVPIENVFENAEAITKERK